MIPHATRVTRRRPPAWRAAFLILLSCGASASPTPTPVEPALVPRPASLELQRGHFDIPASLALRFDRDDASLVELASTFGGRVAKVCSRTLDASEPRGSARRAITLRRLGGVAADADRVDESYRLIVEPRRIELAANDIAGLRQGSTTLLQLLCAPGATSIRALRIVDEPAFAWRGVMLDSARHFQSTAHIKRFLDAMALHKLNVLHWHLTDDQAWRLEIRKYPKLTSVGAWRVPQGAAARADIDPSTGKPRLHGGFYTQDEARAIVAYAARLGITVVPEIEMPGHASAAIAAYPELGAQRAAVTEVPSDWGIYANAFALDEPTFAFLEDVLRETMAVFPSRYIHVGGDEVEATQWLASAPGRALADRAGRADGHALQAWFTERIARFVHDNGRIMVGWDEILSPGLAKDAVVMSWRGIDGALAAAAQGHDTILSPWPTLYLDNRQSPAPDEPPGRVRTISLQDVYAFDPLPPALDATQRKHVLGVQGNVWVEHIRTEARVDHMAFPRVAAIAELGWTPAPRREWGHFARRVASQFEFYQALGVKAADSAFAAQATKTFAADASSAEVALSTITGVGEIRYTTDGSEPHAGSTRYTTPVRVTLPGELRAGVFVAGRAIARPRTFALRAEDAQLRTSRELALCTDNISLMLDDDAPIEGERASFALDIQSPCWFFRAADLSRVTAIEAAVGQLPFNFQIGEAKDRVTFAKPETRDGELEVRLDTCEGELLARLPLAPATSSQAVTLLPRASIASHPGRHDLCLRFAQPSLEPMWAIDSIRLVAP
jgi:hexosaminidase